MKAPTTISYRVTVHPEMGTGLGNTVLVGLDVQSADQRAPLVYEGLPKRIEEVRESLGQVRISNGQLFGDPKNATARELRSLMAIQQDYPAELLEGETIFADAIPDQDYWKLPA